MNEITRSYFARMASFEDGQVAADMRALAEHDDAEAAARLSRNYVYNARMRTTCLARAKPSVPSPLSPAAMKPIEDVTREFWPNVVVVPLMSTGASDGLYLRNAGIPTYGVSGLFSEIGESRAHGRDERVGVQQFYESAQFLFALVKRMSR